MRFLPNGSVSYPIYAQFCIRIKLSEIQLDLWHFVCHKKKRKPTHNQAKFSAKEWKWTLKTILYILVTGWTHMALFFNFFHGLLALSLCFFSWQGSHWHSLLRFSGSSASARKVMINIMITTAWRMQAIHSRGFTKLSCSWRPDTEV